MEENKNCMLCPRKCCVDRIIHMGVCRSGIRPRLARAAKHEWEEPCISGANGSGAVFFSGCALNCVYCQNREISGGQTGREISIEQLSDIFLRLEGQGVHNINLVTPTHYVHAIIPAIERARREGLSIPVVYNTSGYECVDTLKRLEGLIDVWLPDFKYADNETAMRYSRTPDYVETVKAAAAEMFRQSGECKFDEQGMLKKGLLVRHLVLPGQTGAAKKIIKYLYETYQDKVYISIMRQYTPLLTEELKQQYPELARKVKKRDYDAAVDYAIALGVTHAFIQEGTAAKESFIPEFDVSGVSRYLTAP